MFNIGFQHFESEHKKQILPIVKIRKFYIIVKKLIGYFFVKIDFEKIKHLSKPQMYDFICPQLIFTLMYSPSFKKASIHSTSS